MMGPVLSTFADRVRTITLNRPERLNAINPALVDGLVDALREGNDDPATRAIVLRGAGRAFCAGDDLKEFNRQTQSEPETRAYIERIQDVTRAIVFGEKIVIGAVHGWAVGGGLEWVINCDLVLMAENTRCFFPEIGLGVFVTGAVTALLPRMVGSRKALEMILLGERFDARAALDFGIASRVVADADLFEEAATLAARIAALPAERVADLKRTLRSLDRDSIERAMALETEATVRGFLDPESARRAAMFGKGKGSRTSS